MEDESPNGNSEKKCATNTSGLKDANQSCQQQGGRGDSTEEGHGTDAIREPFSGDLQMVLSERDERDSPIVKRKRRKLPEIPKTPSRRCNLLLATFIRANKCEQFFVTTMFKFLGKDGQVSLAQEMSEAEKHSYTTGISMMNGSSSANFNKHHSYVPVSSEGNCTANNTSRPIFILKFNNGIPMGI